MMGYDIRCQYSNLTGNGTTTVKSNSGILFSVLINKIGATGNTLKLSDINGTIGTIDTTIAAAPTRLYNVAFAGSLTAVLASGTSADVTICFQ